MFKRIFAFGIFLLAVATLAITVSSADVSYTGAAGVGSVGQNFSNGVVIYSGVAPTSSGLCLVTGTSGATASYTTCPGGGGGAVSGAIAVSSVAASASAVISSTSINASGVQVASGSVTIGGSGSGYIGATGLTGLNVISIDTGNTLVVEQALRRSDSTPSIGASAYCGKQRGTLASPTIVVNGDTLCNQYGYGYDGIDYRYSSLIKTTVGGTAASGIVPGAISVQTANAAGTLTEAFNVTSSQAVNFQSNVAVAGSLTAANSINVIGTPSIGAIPYYFSTSGVGTVSIYAPTSSSGELEIFRSSGAPTPMPTTVCPAAATSTGLTYAGVATCTSSTLPIYASGGCSTHGTVISSNGPFAFSMTTTGTCSGSQPLIFTMPSSIATTSWHCNARDVTQPTYVVLQTNTVSTTSITLTNYGITLGTAAAWVTGDNVEVECKPY